MSTSAPLAVLLLATAVALLLAASSVVPTAAAAAVSGGRYGGGGRMVFVHGPGTTTKQVGGARGNEWRHYLAPRVEDEVAPEFGGILATNSEGGSISSGTLNKDRPVCPSGSQCAARGGGSYTRPCTYKNQCPH
ncbi:unnamed protein product [Miscanthus lutarioriparius]|uniref:Uncharacterized protein n=1 Tax=Miscanthus lutarioriparius TaxID=422564 RepID=A0A811RIE6_9POAL|nr:unnamed protein product [Miscanthus lutarioriparius]